MRRGGGARRCDGLRSRPRRHAGFWDAGARSGAFVERRVYERRLVAVDAGASSRAFVERGVYERR